MRYQIRFGSIVSPRGLATRELIGVQLEVINFANCVILSDLRNLNYKFMVAEFFWIFEGHNTLASIAPFNSKYVPLSDDGVTLNGAYGPHWKEQKDYVINKLREDPFSRQAVMTFWKPNPPTSKDIPCTVSLQFLLRDGELHVVANMRSSDVWLGIPYDVFTFSQLGNYIANQLGATRGNLTIQLGSSHMYDTDEEAAVAVIRSSIANDLVDCLRAPILEGSYPGSILTGQHGAPVVGLEEPWRTYAQILGRPRSEALASLLSIANL